MRAVVPAPPTAVPPTVSSLYHITASRPLPVINCAVSVRHVVLSPFWRQHFNRFAVAGRRVFGPAYWLGFVMTTATIFTPAPLGVVFAAIATPLQLIPTLVALLVLRYDMVVLLLDTYEFWYMTLMNIVVSVCLGVSFGDARWPVLVSVGVGFELALLIDANVRNTRVIVVGTAFAAMLNLSYVACTTFGVVPTPATLIVVAYHGRTLLLDDVILNVLGTQLLLQTRTAYRKHLAFRDRTQTDASECVTYHCRLAVRSAVGGSDGTLTCHTDKPVPLPASGALRSTLAQLRLVGNRQPLDARDVLGRAIVTRWPVVARSFVLPRILSVCVITSLLAMIVTALSTDTTLVAIAAPLSVATASVVVASYATFAHTTLLRRLFSSFDFLFLSAQMTLTHACVADMVQWHDPRALAVLASWLLTHWVLLLDAVLPVHKVTRLGYRSCIASAVIVVSLTLQLLVLAVVVLAPDENGLNAPQLRLRDRELFSLTLHNHTNVVRVVPLLFGRTLATLSWSLRLLWRLYYSRIDELLLLQGRVELAPSVQGRVVPVLKVVGRSQAQ